MSTTLPVTASAATPDSWSASVADGGNSADNPGEATITSADAAAVRPAWRTSLPAPSSAAPVVTGGVAYDVLSDPDLTAPRLTAVSARTGATLWTLPLPHDQHAYDTALSVTGTTLVIPFNGVGGARGGLMEVNLTTHRIAWSRLIAPTTISWIADWEINAAVTDGTRIYVWGSSYDLIAYRVSDGAQLWTAPVTFTASGSLNGLYGVATGNGVVFTGGDEGIVAYSAISGQRLWRAPGATGTPVVAGGRVYGVSGPTPLDATGVMAFPATGCGRPTCAPLWTTSFTRQDPHFLTVGGADAATLFLTYRADDPRDPNDTWTGTVARLSATTGKVQWTATLGRDLTGLVRGGSTVWMHNEYVDAHDQVADRLVAYSATATSTAPLDELALAPGDGGFPQGLAIASGTVFQQLGRDQLIGYRPIGR